LLYLPRIPGSQPGEKGSNFSGKEVVSAFAEMGLKM
jgi:hypothetical protein